MIILKTSRKINTINQKNYSNVIFSLDLSLLSCPKCSHRGLSVHGYYKKNFKDSSINIQRVICPHCGKTHALLLFPMIPFLSAVSFDDIVSILSDSTDHLIIELSHIYYFIVKLGNCPIDELLIYKKFSRKLYFSFQTTWPLCLSASISSIMKM